MTFNFYGFCQRSGFHAHSQQPLSGQFRPGNAHGTLTLHSSNTHEGQPPCSQDSPFVPGFQILDYAVSSRGLLGCEIAPGPQQHSPNLSNHNMLSVFAKTSVYWSWTVTCHGTSFKVCQRAVPQGCDSVPVQTAKCAVVLSPRSPVTFFKNGFKKRSSNKWLQRKPDLIITREYIGQKKKKIKCHKETKCDNALKRLWTGKHRSDYSLQVSYKEIKPL